MTRLAGLEISWVWDAPSDCLFSIQFILPDDVILKVSTGIWCSSGILCHLQKSIDEAVMSLHQ